MNLNHKVEKQIRSAYRRMAEEARYRPAAPSDGMGNILYPLEELDLDKEQRDYALHWWDEEDHYTFWIGCCDFPTRPATIFAIEAARLLCGGERLPALKLLQMAVKDLERILE